MDNNRKQRGVKRKREDEHQAGVARMGDSTANTTRRTPRVTHEVEEGITVQEAGGPLVGPGSVFVTCAKNRDNPGHHDKFIKVTDFTVDNIPDLPVGCPLSKDLLYELINSNVPLVGRIHGKYISEERPDTWHNGEDGYLFAKDKGHNLNTVGSGRVLYVTENPDGKCKCMNCSEQKELLKQAKPNEKKQPKLTPASPYWAIGVFTARHVMFDTCEAHHSDFVLFDDNDDGSGTATLSGGKVTWGDTERDFCHVRYYTHDQDLAYRLREMVGTCGEIRRQVTQLTTARDRYTLPVFVVAHPHGRQKYVTVGEYKGECGEYNRAVTFTSPTCPGCSGGHVICPVSLVWSVWDVGGGHPHSGVNTEGKGVSASYYNV